MNYTACTVVQSFLIDNTITAKIVIIVTAFQSSNSRVDSNTTVAGLGRNLHVSNSDCHEIVNLI
jgi:hypothetical protein